MTTLRLGDAPVRLSIPIGEALTIVAPAGSSAYVADFSDFDPAASVSGTTQAFGPYTKTETVTVKCTAGAVDFSIAKVDASQAVVSGAGNKAKKIIILSDSTGEGLSTQYTPLDDGRGWWNNFNTWPAAGATMFVTATCSCDFASAATATLTWNATNSTLDVGGAPVTVTGGGFFTLLDSSGNRVYTFVRWRNRTGSGSTTVTASGTRQNFLLTAVSLFGGALMRVGAVGNHNIINYAFGGDTLTDIAARIGQIQAERADIVLLHAGINGPLNFIDETPVVGPLLDSILAATSTVVVSPTIPCGTLDAEKSWLYQNLVDTWRTQIIARGNCYLVDLQRFARGLTATSTGAIVAGLFNASDNLHPYIGGTFGVFADQLSTAMQKLNVTAMPRYIGQFDNWDATNNPLGNLLAAKSLMTGTAGTKGATPIPTGNAPTSWTDANAGLAGSFTSVAITPADDGSAVARTDAAGNWATWVCSTASGGEAGRDISCSLPASGSGWVVGKKLIVGLALKLRSASQVTRLQVMMSFGGGSGGVGAALLAFPNTSMPSGFTLPDSGVLYVCSRPITVPVGTTGIIFFVQVRCATGGSVTLDLADPFVLAAP